MSVHVLVLQDHMSCKVGIRVFPSRHSGVKVEEVDIDIGSELQGNATTNEQVGVSLLVIVCCVPAE